MSSTNQIPTTAEAGDTIYLIVQTPESFQTVSFLFSIGGEFKEQEDLNITHYEMLDRFTLTYDVTAFDNGEVEFLFQGTDANGVDTYINETTDDSIVAVGYIPTVPTPELRLSYSIDLDAEDDTGLAGDGKTAQKENLTFSGYSLPESTVRLLYKGQDPNRNDVWTAFGLTPNVATAVADSTGSWTIPNITFNDHAASYVEEIGIRVTPVGETAFINPEETAIIDFSIQDSIYSIELDSEDDTGLVGDGKTAQKEDLTFSGYSLPESTVRLLYKGQDPNRNDVWTAFGLTPNVATAVADSTGSWTIPNITFNDHAASYVEEIGIRVTPVGETAFINPEETAIIDFSIQDSIYSIELNSEDDTGTLGDNVTLQQDNLTFNGTSVPAATVQLFYYNGSIWTAGNTTPKPATDIVDEDGNWSIDVSFNDISADSVERIGIRTTEADGTVTNPYKKYSPSSTDFKINKSILGVPNIKGFASNVIPELNQIAVSTTGTTNGFVTNYAANEIDIMINLNDSTNHVSSSLELEGFAPGVLSSADPNITKIKFQDWSSDTEAKEAGKVFFDADSLVLRAAETDTLLNTRVTRWSLLLNENSEISITASLETDTDLFLYRTLSTNSFDGTIDGTVGDDISEVHFFDKNDNHIHTETVFQNNWSFDLENLITTVGLQDSYTLQLKHKDVYGNLSDNISEITFVVDVIAPSVEYYEKLSDDLFMIRMSEDLFNIAYKETVNTGFSISDLNGLNIYDPVAISILEDTVLLFFSENTYLPEEGVITYVQANDIEIKDLSGNIYTQDSTQQYIDSTKRANVFLGKLNYLKSIYGPFNFSEEPKVDVLIEVNNLSEVDLILKANNISDHKILENLDLIFANIDEGTLAALNSSVYVDMIFENKENEISQTSVATDLNKNTSGLTSFINNSNYQGEYTVVAVVDSGIKKNNPAFTPIISSTGLSVPRIAYKACYSYETDSDAIVDHITDELVDALSFTHFVEEVSRYGFLGSLISIVLKPVLRLRPGLERHRIRATVEISLHQYGIDFYEGLCDSPCTSAEDCDHGTKVASVISGEIDTVNKYHPVAPRSQIANFKASSKPISGSCETSGTCGSISFVDVSVVESINDIIEQKKNGLNIVAANFSLGGTTFENITECNTDNKKTISETTYNLLDIDLPSRLFGDEDRSTYRNALKKLYDVNIIPVVASGNNFERNKIDSPSCLLSENVVVGSLHKPLSGGIAKHSNINEVVDFVAPGYQVKVIDKDGNYDDVNGTSFAAPYIAGSFAILRSRYPDASINRLINRLKSHSVFFSDTRSGAVHTSPIFPYPYNPAGAAEGPISNIVATNSAGKLLTFNTSTEMYETDEDEIMVFIKADSNLAKITVENEHYNRLNTIEDITTSHQTEPYILVDTIPLKSAYVNLTEVFTVQVEALDTLSSNPNDFVKYTNEIIKINKTNPFTLLESDEHTTYPLDDYVLSKNEIEGEEKELLSFASGTDTDDYRYALTHPGNCHADGRDPDGISPLTFTKEKGMLTTKDPFFKDIAISETVLCVKIDNFYRPINFDIYIQLEFKNEIKKFTTDNSVVLKFQPNVTGKFSFSGEGGCANADGNYSIDAGVTKEIIIIDSEVGASELKAVEYICEITIASSKNKMDEKSFAVPTFAVLRPIVVGAVGKYDNGYPNGAVYVFEFDSTSNKWDAKTKISGGTTNNNPSISQQLKIPENFNKRFGYSLGINSNTLAVGATGVDKDQAIKTSQGAVIFFEKNGSNWEQAPLLSSVAIDTKDSNKKTNINTNNEDEFGKSIDYDGEDLIVGATYVNKYSDGDGYGKGLVYNLEKDSSGVWSKTFKISDNKGGTGKLDIDLDDYDYFGRSVSSSGNILFVGAPGDDDGGTARGAVHRIYREDLNADWSDTYLFKISSITKVELNDYDHFGTSVSYSDSTRTLVVGAPGDDDGGTDRGAVYVFRRNLDGSVDYETKISNNGGVDGKLDVDLDDYDEFGKSVSLNKDYLLIGATGDDDGGSNKGAVYIFEKDSDGNWFKSFKISDNDSVQDINNKINGFNAIDINLEEFSYFGIDVEVFQYDEISVKTI